MSTICMKLSCIETSEIVGNDVYASSFPLIFRPRGAQQSGKPKNRAAALRDLLRVCETVCRRCNQYSRFWGFCQVRCRCDVSFAMLRRPLGTRSCPIAAREYVPLLYNTSLFGKIPQDIEKIFKKFKSFLLAYPKGF